MDVPLRFYGLGKTMRDRVDLSWGVHRKEAERAARKLWRSQEGGVGVPW